MAYQISADCTGCTACARICPVFAIEGERGAQHAINPARCVECGVCARVCPQKGIANAAGKRLSNLPRKEWPKPAIRQTECSACQMCVDICTPGALSISLPKTRGNLDVFAQLSEPSKCIGCGQCAEICPLRIIEMQGGTT